MVDSVDSVLLHPEISRIYSGAYGPPKPSHVLSWGAGPSLNDVALVTGRQMPHDG